MGASAPEVCGRMCACVCAAGGPGGAEQWGQVAAHAARIQQGQGAGAACVCHQASADPVQRHALGGLHRREVRVGVHTGRGVFVGRGARLGKGAARQGRVAGQVGRGMCNKVC